MAKSGLTRRIERLEEARDEVGQSVLNRICLPPRATNYEEWLEQRGRWRYNADRGWWLTAELDDINAVGA